MGERGGRANVKDCARVRQTERDLVQQEKRPTAVKDLSRHERDLCTARECVIQKESVRDPGREGEARTGGDERLDRAEDE